MNAWTVGQSVVVVTSRRVYTPNAFRDVTEEKIENGTVVKVGRQFLHVERYPSIPAERFRLSDGQSVDRTMFDSCRVFESREAFERIAAARDAWHAFSAQIQPMLFGSKAPAHLTVETIEQLRNLIRNGVAPGGIG